MTDTTFQNHTANQDGTLTDAAWFQDMNDFYYTIFGTPSISTQVFDIAANGDVSILDTAGGTPFFLDVSANQLQIGKGLSTQDANIEIGAGRTGNGNSYIDFIGDTTYPGYGARIIRSGASGANSNTDFYHRGTGVLNIISSDAGSIALKTNNTTALTVDSTQKVGIGISSSILAKTHIDQASTTAAIPVLYLDQADISEEMIQFETTIGVGNAIEAVGAKTLTTTHFIKVTLPGALTRYIPAGTIA